MIAISPGLSRRVRFLVRLSARATATMPGGWSALSPPTKRIFTVDTFLESQYWQTVRLRYCRCEITACYGVSEFRDRAARVECKLPPLPERDLTFDSRRISDNVFHVDQIQADTYIRGICFKTGPPRLLGVELEWLVRDRGDPAAPVSRDRITAALAPLGGTATDGDVFNGGAPRLPSGARITIE